MKNKGFLVIISEKQVHQLITVAHIYLRLIEDIYRQQPDALSNCGNNNKLHVAKLLQDIVSQQSVVNMVIQ